MKKTPLPSILCVSLVAFILLWLTACGALNTGRATTAAPGIQIDATVTPPETPVETSPTPLSLTTATPTPYMDHWIAYSNPVFAISLQYPVNWQPAPGYGAPETGEIRYAGDNGFFHVNAIGAATIDDAVASEAGHKLQPYGSGPIVEKLEIQGQEARLIMPSADQAASMGHQAALIVRYPQPVNIAGSPYPFFVLWADQPHIRTIAQTLRFDGGSGMSDDTPDPFPVGAEDLTPAPSAIASGFWASVGTSPDTRVAILTQPERSSARYGDIATAHLDGTEHVQLTTYHYNADPVLSPDRQRIAYRSVPKSITSLSDPGPRLYEGIFNIWVITVDGAQAWQLTASELQRSVPVWSYDGRKVAFTEGPEGVLVEIDVDTAAHRELTSGAMAPRYRPDGGGLGYISVAGGLTWIDVSGTAHIIVPPDTLPPNTLLHDFDWMPDGNHVVYTLADETERVAPFTSIGIKYSVWVTKADGSHTAKLTDCVHSVQTSPDGQIVAALAGSGYGDACFIDRQLVFLLLDPDFTAAQRVQLDAFQGHPPAYADASFYPSSNITWVSERLAFGEFRSTCLAYPGAAGRYVIDPHGERMFQVASLSENPYNPY